jgi:lipocalin
MVDRRNLLGTSAVLVGLGSALISGTAVAAADTGDNDARQSDSSAASAPAASPSSDASADTPTRRAPRGRGSGGAAPAATVKDDVPAAEAPVEIITSPRGGAVAEPESVPSDAPAPAPAPAAAAVPAAATVVSQPAPPVDEAPVAVVDVASASTTAAGVAEAAPAPVTAVAALRVAATPAVAAVTAAPAASAYVAPAPAPAPAPASSVLLDVLSGFGGGPAGGAVIATPALAGFTGQRESAAPAAVVGSPVVAAAPPDPGAALPTNGVTGVQIGHSQLTMPGAFIGDSVAADWYFPTQVDGSVQAQGVIWLQHGFGANNIFYSALAEELATKTNSIVVAPNLSSIPFTFSGSWLNGKESQEAAAAMFLDPNRTELVKSAVEAGYTGDVELLKGSFVLTGHSAGGGFASAVGSDYVTEGTTAQDADLAGVVMFDGVSNGAFSGDFTKQVQALVAAGKPIYQIAAPAQIWNAFAATTNQLLAANPGAFDGVVLVGGSHVDSMLGVNSVFDTVLQLVAGFVPPGNTAATYALSTGWINDFYAGATPNAPQYGIYAPANQQIIFGDASGVALPTVTLNQVGPIGGVLKSVTDAIFKLFGIPPTPEVNTGSNGVTALVTAPNTNGVTGVKTGSADLVIPSGNGYNAPADWYFPTQADGSVQANGIIWLQHGFLGFKGWYSDMAVALAQETNSVVVVPQINWFDDAFSGEAAAEMFVGSRPALNISANKAGYTGVLPQKFVLTGHSAGGSFATVAGAGTVDNGAAADLLGVVMFDGVSFPDRFAPSIAKLDTLGIPDYQIAAPPQSWNAWGQTTEELAQLHPDRFIGTMIDQGSHTDSVAGSSAWGDIGEVGSAIFVGQSPPGAQQAVRTFATGWINDFYAGLAATDPQPKYGIYGNPNDGSYAPNRPLVMGRAGANTLPSPPPVDVDKYAGTWFEQGSVKQFFAIGLVNTKAVYTPQPDGTIKVENSGNYFGPNGPESNITGSAVPVNSPTNTRLNVGFGFGDPNNREPGNYWILDYDPDYKWVIVSDPSYRSGYILTRDQTIPEDEYNALVARAQQLGVKGRITVTEQFPPTSAAAAGPASVPSSIAI